MSFESLNVQLLVIGLASRPHCKQDLGPFLGQASENSFVDMVLASTMLIVSPSPFIASETGETPVSERPPQWLNASCPHADRLPLTAGLSNRTTARQTGKSAS